MKYNNDILNKIVEVYSTEYHNNLGLDNITSGYIERMKKGSKIHIKKKNRGKFTEYCGGKVTSECIAKGKRSPDPAIRKRATFAANSRKWNKK